jgi:hypothetical protein
MKDREKMAICRYHGMLPHLCNITQLDGRGHGLLVVATVAVVLVFSWGRQNWFLTIEPIVVLVQVPSKLFSIEELIHSQFL